MILVYSLSVLEVTQGLWFQGSGVAPYLLAKRCDSQVEAGNLLKCSVQHIQNGRMIQLHNIAIKILNRHHDKTISSSYADVDILHFSSRDDLHDKKGNLSGKKMAI